MDTNCTFDGGGLDLVFNLNLDGDRNFDLTFDYNGIELGGTTNRWETDRYKLQLCPTEAEFHQHQAVDVQPRRDQQFQELLQLCLGEAEIDQHHAKELLQIPSFNIGKFSGVSAAFSPHCGRIFHFEENAEIKIDHIKRE